MSRENTVIRYAALALAIVLVGSVLASGLVAAKAPDSGATHKVKNAHAMAKGPNPATNAIALKPDAKIKAAVKPTVKPTVKPKVKPKVKPTKKP